MATYAEDQEWPPANSITTSHVEEYLTHLRTRPRYFGREKVPHLLSKTHVESQYRRLKTFLNWCVKRGHRETNPLNLIPHPKIDEKTVPTISELEFADFPCGSPCGLGEVLDIFKGYVGHPIGGAGLGALGGCMSAGDGYAAAPKAVRMRSSNGRVWSNGGVMCRASVPE